MSQLPLSVRLTKAMKFDASGDKQTVIDKWPGAPYPCADYFTRGRSLESARLQPFLEVLVELTDSVGKTYHGSQQKEECSICQSLIKLQTLLDAKEG